MPPSKTANLPYKNLPRHITLPSTSPKTPLPLPIPTSNSTTPSASSSLPAKYSTSASNSLLNAISMQVVAMLESTPPPIPNTTGPGTANLLEPTSTVSMATHRSHRLLSTSLTIRIPPPACFPLPGYVPTNGTTSPPIRVLTSTS